MNNSPVRIRNAVRFDGGWSLMLTVIVLSPKNGNGTVFTWTGWPLYGPLMGTPQIISAGLVGFGVGAKEGAADGVSEGASVLIDGADVISVGLTDGERDGVDDGLVDGARVGVVDGVFDGVDVGVRVGDADG